MGALSTVYRIVHDLTGNGQHRPRAFREAHSISAEHSICQINTSGVDRHLIPSSLLLRFRFA
jgi:hypothetical protein